MADRRTAFLFTRYGLGDAPEDLGLKVLGNFLGLLRQSDELPAALLFYTNGVKLACEGSPVLDALRSFDEAGVHLTVLPDLHRVLRPEGQGARRGRRRDAGHPRHDGAR